MSDTEPYCFSKQQLRAAPQHHCHGVIVTSTPTPSWMRTTSIVSQCQLCEYSCCRDPVSCLLPALSHRPVLRNISVVNVLLYSVSASLKDCTAESCIRTSVLGRRGSKALLLALHDKDESFFIKSQHQMGWIREKMESENLVTHSL